MRVIDLRGSAAERGRQQGEAVRDEVQRALDEVLSSEMWLENRPLPLPKTALRWALSAVGRAFTMGPVRRALPEQASRVQGLAQGLRRPHGATWGLQFLEVLFCEAGSSLVPPGPSGCTVVLAGGDVTHSRTPLMARNYDFPNLLRRYQVVRREEPTQAGRKATVTVTQVAMAGAHQGVNEAGLAASFNNARIWRGKHLKRRGVPLSLLLQEVLETCTTTSEAVGVVQRFGGNANAGFLGFLDRSGDASVVECTAATTAVRPAEGGMLAQANHFQILTEVNVPEGTRWTVRGMEGVEYLVGSRARQSAAAEVLRANAGHVEVESLQRLLSNHGETANGSDVTVCCHGHTGGTLAGIVVDVAARKLFVAEGHPCEGAWQEVGFPERAGAEQAA